MGGNEHNQGPYQRRGRAAVWVGEEGLTTTTTLLNNGIHTGGSAESSAARN